MADTDPWAERALAAMRQFLEAMDHGDEEGEHDAIMQIEALVEERRE